MSEPIRYGAAEKRRLKKLQRGANVSVDVVPREPFLRLRSFLWLGVLAVIAGFVFLKGLPALRWQYTYHETGQLRYYTQCDYVSLHNKFERHLPVNGQCPLFMLRPIKRV